MNRIETVLPLNGDLNRYPLDRYDTTVRLLMTTPARNVPAEVTWQPSITANWEMTNGGRWIVPLGGGVGRMRLGAQPVNLTMQFYSNAVHPPAGSSWTMQLGLAFLFPVKPKA